MKPTPKILVQILVVAVAVRSQALASESNAKAGKKIPTPSQWMPFADAMHNTALAMSVLISQSHNPATFEGRHNIMQRELLLAALKQEYSDAENGYYKLLSDINS